MVFFAFDVSWLCGYYGALNQPLFGSNRICLEFSVK